MAGIQEYLDLIKNAVYGREVRQAIHDGIETCYNEGKAGATDLEARQRISELAHLEEGSTTGDAELIDARTVGEATYPSLHDAIDTSVAILNTGLDEVLDNIIDFSTIDSVNTGGVNFVVDKGKGTITATGTAVRNLVIVIRNNITGYSSILLKGGPIGGSTTTYTLAIYNNTSGARVGYDNGSEEGTEVTLDPAGTYRIAVVVMKEKTVSDLKFTPRAYVGGLITDIKRRLDTASSSRYIHFAGRVYICECGNHIFLDAVGFRVFDTVSKTFTSALTGTTILAGGSSSIRYIDFDGEEFSLSSVFTNTSIAYVYNKSVHALIDGLILNYRKIQDGYIREGSEFYINYNRTPINAIGAYSEPNIKVSERGYVYKQAGTVTYDIEETSHSFVLESNTVNIDNKKVLMIGDSFVARGHIHNWLHNLNNTLQFIGTKVTSNYDYRCEGVSGSRLYYFTDPATSPFYFNGSLNFAQYLVSNDLPAPDYVVINSAINHTSYDNVEHGSYLSNVNALVNMIKAYDSNIKIYVTYGANYAIDPASVYGYPARRFREVRKCCNSVYDVDGVVVIPVDSALIDELDYNRMDIDYLGSTINVLSDCVHPSENVGFRKIANMIFNYLGV